MQKERKKEVKKKKEIQFLVLEAKFCYSLDLNFPNHIFAFKFELCAKKSGEIKNKSKKKEKKRKQNLHLKSFLFLHTFISKKKLCLVGYLHLV